ncbi:hypothetical protein NA57DRAFT_18783, partial [Rhizodiscina lignyota]
MALEVLPLLEADLPEYCRIHFTAFTKGMSQFFGPASSARDQNFLDSQRKQMLEDPTVFFLKAVDPQTGAIIGCAKYHKFNPPKSKDEIKASYAARPPPEGANVEAWSDLFSWLEEARTKYLGGKTCWFLSILIADPANGRRGAGSALLHWGNERADKDKLPIFLEASPMARPLYERFGYEIIEEREFDLSKYGGQGKDYNTAMVR